MNSSLREMYFCLIDGELNDKMTHHLEMLDNFKYRARMGAWLITNRITGLTLLDWVDVEFHGSMLEACKEIVRRVNGDVIRRPVIASRDFRN